VCRDLVLVMNAVNRMDSTAVDTLAELNRDLLAQGIRLHFAEIKGPVQDRLQNTALWRQLSGQVFLSASTAFDTLASPDTPRATTPFA
jgi:SulP family sulfate permease